MQQFIFLFKRELLNDFSAQEMQNYLQKWLIWIKTLNEKHLFITGESLERNGKQITGINKIVSNYDDHRDIITGFCIVKAKNIDEAIEASFSCPIYDIDGSIEIRQIKEAV